MDEKPYTITIEPGHYLTPEEFDILPREQEGWKRVLVGDIIVRMPENELTNAVIADLMKLKLIWPRS